MAAADAFKNPEHVEKLVKGSTEFALDLYKEVCKDAGDGKNVFMSPISLTTALAMVCAGAKANTAEQMKQTLKFTELPEEHLHSTFEDFQSTLSGSKEKVNYILQAANKLFAHNGYNILQEYLDVTKKHYSAEAQTCDFAHDAAGSRSVINKWVEAQTNEKIKDLIPDGFINERTRLILVNAIYFKGNWKDQFNPERTRKSNFYINDKDTVEVDMMFQEEQFALGFDKALGVQVIEIPYIDEHLSMFVMLPRARTGLADFESKLTSEKLTELMTKVGPKRKAMLHLPRFKLEHQFSAKDMLMALGMKDAFTDAADLSGISGNKDLQISEVVHKAYIEVNEEGSEAAAATAVLHKAMIEVNEEGSEAAAASAVMAMLRMMPPEFVVDHPFLFCIRDNRSLAVLFLGRVFNPNNGN